MLGLTNGPGFTPNPCLAEQTAHVRERHLLAGAYAVASYPDDATLARYADQGPFDGSSELGALGNVGYQQALYNVTSMQRVGLVAPVVWIDVEPVPTSTGEPGRRGERRGRAGGGPRLHRQRVRDRDLLHANAVVRGGRHAGAGGPGVACRRPDVAGRGDQPVRGRLGDPGWPRRARPVGGAGTRPERHVRHGAPRSRALVPPVLTYP